MSHHRRVWVASLCLLFGLLVAVGSCGGTHGSGSGASAGSAGSTGIGGSITLAGSGAGQSALTITPMNPSLLVKVGSPVPTQAFTALDNGAQTVAGWSVDRGEIGTIGPSTGVFTPTGNVAGVVTVTAVVGMLKATTHVTVSIQSTQNGALPGDNPTMTVGTVGDGVGGPVDMTTQGVLTGAPMADPALTMLYPYDQTAWPRGLLAPLLQWTAPSANPTAIHVHLKSAYFQYDGFFSTPPKLPAGGAFVRHPIPPQAWQQATDSVDSVSGTDTLVMTLVVASGGKAYGPLTETWKVAPGRLAGTVYYNSYGTALATQLPGALPDGHYFGGAVLGIKGSSLGPSLVSGSTTNGSGAGCRVCHVGSQDGTRLLVATGSGYASAVSVDLTQPSYPETPTGDNLVFAGLYPDGSMAMRTGAPSWDGASPGYGAKGPSALLTVPAGTAVATSGFSGVVSQAATPAFAHDGSKIAFNFLAGPGAPPALPAGDGSQLVTMSFDKATGAFAGPKVLYAAPAGRTPGWPAFLPTDKGIIFDNETVAASAASFSNVHAGTVFLGTSLGARSELWWVDLASGTAYPLHQLNGKSKDGTSLYLPKGPNNHGLDTNGGGPPGDDSTLNFEASVSPVVAGGYIWVIFTSRRMFGNVATVNPWWSDPRDHDISVDPTPKKLWVAAIDLNAQPGTDPSHPAFYLPAQELLAGNSRGFWVLDPCKQDGASCQSGDQCCTGFCQPTGPSQGLTCGNNTSMCAGLQDKCTTSSDCCTAGAVCVNGFCALSPTQ